MPNDNLAFKYSTLRSRIGYHLGYTRTSGNWTTDEQADIDDCLQSGLSQFYHPPPVGGEKVSYEWSFIKPTTTTSVWGDLTYTASGDPDGGQVITATGTTPLLFDTMVGKTITFTTSENTYTIASVDTVNRLFYTTAAMSGETSGDTFGVASGGDYLLPANHGGFVGDLHFDQGDNAAYSITLTTVNRILAQRQQNIGQATPTSRPLMAAERPNSQADGDQTAQRSTLMVWPEPSGVYTMHHQIHILPVPLEDDSFPRGSQVHAECLLASCLGIAEQRMEDTVGLHSQAFMRLLKAAVDQDRRTRMPQTLGFNQDRSDGAGSLSRRFHEPATYNSTEYFGP